MNYFIYIQANVLISCCCCYTLFFFFLFCWSFHTKQGNTVTKMQSIWRKQEGDEGRENRCQQVGQLPIFSICWFVSLLKQWYKGIRKWILGLSTSLLLQLYSLFSHFFSDLNVSLTKFVKIPCSLISNYTGSIWAIKVLTSMVGGLNSINYNHCLAIFISPMHVAAIQIKDCIRNVGNFCISLI